MDPPWTPAAPGTDHVDAVGSDAGSKLRQAVNCGHFSRVQRTDVSKQDPQLSQLLLYDTLDTAGTDTQVC